MQKHNNSGIIINSLSYNTEMKKGGVNRKMFFGTEGNAKLIYPVVFPEWKDLTAKARSNHWIPEEILMDTDAEQHQTLPEHMRRAYEMMLSYLTASDILVPTYLMQMASQAVSSCELMLFLTRQMEEEGIHTQSYRYMLEHLHLTGDEIEELLLLTHNVPEFRNKLNWNIDYARDIFRANTGLIDVKTLTSKEDADIIRSAVENLYLGMMAYLVFEYCYFPAGFTIFFNIRIHERKMMGTDSIFRYIMRDEFLHAKNTKMCIAQLVQEYPQYITPELKKQALQVFDEAVVLEEAAADNIFFNGEKMFGDFSKNEYMGHFRYLIDLAKQGAGLMEKVNSKSPIMDWMSSYYTDSTQLNRFEVQSTQYRSGRTKFKQDVVRPSPEEILKGIL